MTSMCKSPVHFVLAHKKEFALFEHRGCQPFINTVIKSEKYFWNLPVCSHPWYPAVEMRQQMTSACKSPVHSALAHKVDCALPGH